MTKQLAMLILEPMRVYGMTEKEIREKGRDRHPITWLLKKLLLQNLVRRYKAPHGGYSVWRFLLTENGRNRLAYYRLHRTREVERAERMLKE